MMLYSPSLNGFFHPNSKYKPSDCVEITKIEHEQLVQSQSNDKVIYSDSNGKPILIDAPTKKDDEAAQLIRIRRNFLLKDSDWAVSSDSPLSDSKKKEWKKYRQELRDISSQSGFPHNVVFPETP